MYERGVCAGQKGEYMNKVYEKECTRARGVCEGGMYEYAREGMVY